MKSWIDCTCPLNSLIEDKVEDDSGTFDIYRCKDCGQEHDKLFMDVLTGKKKQ